MTTKPLKPGWKVWRFDQMAHNVNERIDDPSKSGAEFYVGLDHLDSDSLKIRRWGSPDEVEATKLCFKKGDIIFGRRRAYQRKLGVAEFDGICSAHAMVLRAKPEVVLPEFLPFFMQSDLFMKRAVEISVGSLSPTINWKTMAIQEFALPPLEEQKRAVETSLAIQFALDSHSDCLCAIDNLRRSSLDDFFKSSPSQNLTRIDQVAVMQNGRPFPGGDYLDSGVKLLRPGNLGADGYLFWGNDKTVYLNPIWETDAADFVVAEGDVLINLTAQSLEDGFMGRVCLARTGDTSLLNQRIGRFRCDPAKVLSEYLYRGLQTTHFRLHAEANCEGSKVKHLFWQHLAKFELLMPSLDVQCEVIMKMREIDDAISLEKSRLSTVADLYREHTNLMLAGVGS